MLGLTQVRFRSSNRTVQKRTSQFVYKGLKKEIATAKKKQRARSIAGIIRSQRKDFTLDDLRKLMDEQTKTRRNPPTSLDVPVYDFNTGEVTNRTISLSPTVFASNVRVDILHRYVVWYLANKRQGTTLTKNRSMVQGSTRKLFSQKGTGRARRGDIKSPLLKGGGKAHGAKKRDWSFHLNRKVRNYALRSALAAKFANSQLYIVNNLDFKPEKKDEDVEYATKVTKEEDYEVDEDEENEDKRVRRRFKKPKKPKEPFRYTRPLLDRLEKLEWEKDTILVNNEETHPDMVKALRNIPTTKLTSMRKLNVYEILKAKKLVLHEESLDYLCHRSISKPLERAKYQLNMVEQEAK